MRRRAERDPALYAISALNGDGINDLLDAVTQVLQGQKRQATITLSYADGRKRAWLFQHELVETENQTDTGFELTVRWTAAQEDAFNRL